MSGINIALFLRGWVFSHTWSWRALRFPFAGGWAVRFPPALLPASFVSWPLTSLSTLSLPGMAYSGFSSSVNRNKPLDADSVLYASLNPWDCSVYLLLTPRGVDMPLLVSQGVLFCFVFKDFFLPHNCPIALFSPGLTDNPCFKIPQCHNYGASQGTS